MFNFISDASSIANAEANNLNVSAPKWTVFIDSDNWALVVAD